MRLSHHALEMVDNSPFAQIADGLDVEPLRQSIESQPELWSEITARQSTPGSPHTDTEAIFLRWSRSQTVEAVFTDLDAIDYPSYAKLPEARDLIERTLDRVGARELGRVLVTALRPGGMIRPHVDEGAYADHYERFHVPLDSDEGSTFLVEPKPGMPCGAAMRPGQLWWFNHKLTHLAYNSGKAFRIHLIVDAVAPRYRKERE